MLSAIRTGTIHSTRNMSVLSGPPRVKISGLEKLLHGTAIVTGIFATPVYVLLNLKNYKGPEPEQ